MESGDSKLAAETARLPPSLLAAQDLLRRVSARSGIQVSGGLASDTAISLDKLFVNLTILAKDDLKTLFEHSSLSTDEERKRQKERFAVASKKNIELEQLFSCDVPDSSDEPLSNALVFGSAGSGKTTVFLKMLMHLWCTGRLWRDDIDLVLALELREAEVQAASSLAELLAVKLASQGMEKDELLELSRYFRANPRRLCVILDGLDECSFVSCNKYMRDLLLRDGLVDARVIVTSRPGTDAYKLSQCGRYQQQVEVLGFSAENVREYVHKVVGGQDADDMLEKLEGKADVAALMSTPMFAALACELYMCGKRVAQSTTELYESLLLRVVERQGGAACSSFANAEARHVQALYELGHFAFCMLASKKLVFTECELKSSRLSDAARRLGLLQACSDSSSTKTRQYRFSHLSIQEFLSAWFMARCVLKEKRHCVRLVERLGVYGGHLTMFWNFLIALLPSEVAFAVLNRIWHAIRESTGTDMGASLAEEMQSNPSVLSLELEMETIQDELSSVLTFEHMKKLANILLEKAYGAGNGCTRVENAIPRGRELSNELFLQTLLSLWKENECITSGTVLLDALRRIDAKVAEACEIFLHPGAPLVCGSSTHCTVATSSTGSYERVDGEKARGLLQLLVAYREHTEYHGVCCDERCALLSDLFSQCVLLEYVSLSVSECSAIGLVLSSHSCVSFEKVYCRLTYMGDVGFASVAAGLKQCKNVRELVLVVCDITDGALLASVISALSAGLEVVNVSGNVVGAAGHAHVCHAVSECKKVGVVHAVHAVHAGIMHGDGESLDALSEMVEKCTELSELYVAGNTYACSDAEGRRFVSAVREHATLHELYMPGRVLSEYVVSELRSLQSDSQHSLSGFYC